MADLYKLKENLEKVGFAASVFETAAEAADYLDRKLDGTTIGIGGSLTVRQMGLYEKLNRHNKVIWHHEGGNRLDASRAEVYLSSVNAAAETGELINIDGTGNRVAATIYGPKRVYFLVGVNKVEPDYDRALWRAKNIAAPKNAQRLGVKTPCAEKGDKCYDCKSPQRICRVLTVFWAKPTYSDETEVLLINEELGL